MARTNALASTKKEWLLVAGESERDFAPGATQQFTVTFDASSLSPTAGSPAAKYPFRLFDYHRQLLQEGLFDAYNQWIFGAVQNLPAYQNWTTLHADEYAKFTNFQKGRVFKLPEKTPTGAST